MIFQLLVLWIACFGYQTVTKNKCEIKYSENIFFTSKEFSEHITFENTFVDIFSQIVRTMPILINIKSNIFIDVPKLP